MELVDVATGRQHQPRVDDLVVAGNASNEGYPKVCNHGEGPY